MNYSEYYIKLNSPESLKIIQSDVLKLSDTLTSGKRSSIYFLPIDYSKIDSLTSYLNSMSLMKYICSYGHTFLHSGESLSIHKDPPRHKWSLLIPLRNAEQTETVFYETTHLPEVKSVLKDDGKTITWDDYQKDWCDEICKVVIDSPTFINTQKIHTANNLGNTTREVLIVRLSKEFECGTAIF